MKQLEKALIFCSAGNTMEYFRRTGILGALEKVMLDDRLADRAKYRELIILDGTSRENPLREQNCKTHLERVFQAGARMNA
jgi:NAD(P)H dehydrogenase (quinone)